MKQNSPGIIDCQIKVEEPIQEEEAAVREIRETETQTPDLPEPKPLRQRSPQAPSPKRLGKVRLRDAKSTFSAKVQKIQRMEEYQTLNPKKIEKILRRRQRRQQRYMYEPHSSSALFQCKSVAQLANIPPISLDCDDQIRHVKTKPKELLPPVEVKEIEKMLEKSPM